MIFNRKKRIVKSKTLLKKEHKVLKNIPYFSSIDIFRSIKYHTPSNNTTLKKKKKKMIQIDISTRNRYELSF